MKLNWYILGNDRIARSIHSGKVLGAIFALTGIVLFFIGYHQLYTSNKSKSWSTTTGTVFYSKLVKGKNPDNKITYQPLIKYKYSVDDVIYRSDRIFFGNMSEQSSPILSLSYLERFPEKSEVIVYYHPYNHGKSVLISGETRYAKQLMIISGIFIVVGIMIMIYLFGKEKQLELDKI